MVVLINWQNTETKSLRNLEQHELSLYGEMSQSYIGAE